MMSILSRFQQPRYWSLSLLVGLSALYGAMLWREDDSAHLGMSLLFGSAAASLLWDKRHQFTFHSDRLSQLMGMGAIAVMLYGCWHNPHSLRDVTLNPMVRLFPFVTASAVGLLASGWRGWKQYWQPLTILFFLGVPSVLATYLPDFSPMTAFSAGLLLWYGGFAATVHGTTLQLPTGVVEVYAGCSGIESMTYLLGISMVCLLTFPIQGTKRFLIPLLAIALGYLVNVVRVAAMAILVASQNLSAFNYWHTGQGSLWVGAIALTIFSLFYLFLVQREERLSLSGADSMALSEDSDPVAKNRSGLGKIR